jgi:hypothetical protein
MQRWQLTEPLHYLRDLSDPRRRLEVRLDSAREDGYATIEYLGPPEVVARLRERLSLSSGCGGYLIGARTTPMDLRHAMRSHRMEAFEPRVLQDDTPPRYIDRGVRMPPKE